MNFIRSISRIFYNEPSEYQRCLQEFRDFEPKDFICEYLLSLPLKELKNPKKAEMMALEEMSKKIKSLSQKCRRAWEAEMKKTDLQKQPKNRLSTIEEG